MKRRTLVSDALLALLSLALVLGINVLVAKAGGPQPAIRSDQQVIQVSVTLVGTVLGVVLTILTIFYTFSANLAASPVMRLLRKEGLEADVYSRLFASALVHLASLPVLLLLSATGDEELARNGGLRAIFWFVASYNFVRMFRAFWLFHLFHDAQARLDEQSRRGNSQGPDLGQLTVETKEDERR